MHRRPDFAQGASKRLPTGLRDLVLEVRVVHEIDIVGQELCKHFIASRYSIGIISLWAVFNYLTGHFGQIVK